MRPFGTDRDLICHYVGAEEKDGLYLIDDEDKDDGENIQYEKCQCPVTREIDRGAVSFAESMHLYTPSRCRPHVTFPASVGSKHNP